MPVTTRIVLDPDYYLDPFDVEEGEDCTACYGTGEDDDEGPCIDCGGMGYI